MHSTTVSALQRLKEARLANKKEQQQQLSHSAARSDADNDAYLQHFNEALGQPTSQPAPATAGGQLRTPEVLPQHNTASRATKHNSIPAAQTPNTDSSLRLSSAVKSTRLEVLCPLDPAPTSQHISPRWRHGPVDEAGLLVKVSERPLLCSAVLADGSVVVGSSDHALYVVDIHAGGRKRTLFTKATGHTEWVTTVCGLPGGRVLSGGMDGRLWLWPAAGAAGTELASAHQAPVSKVAPLLQHHPVIEPPPDPPQQQQQASAAAHPASRAGPTHHLSRNSSASSSSNSSRPRRAPAVSARGQVASSSVPAATAGDRQHAACLAVSCSYDKTVKLWDVSGRAGRQVAVMSGHTGPVLELAVAPDSSRLLTGDRKGSIVCWDVSTASSGWGVKEAHAGHITAVAWQQQQQQQQLSEQLAGGAGGAAPPCLLALSGGQDGCLRAWDGRVGSCVARQALHVDAQGKGAIGGIVTVSQGSRQLVVTAGADQTLKVVDAAAGYKPLHTVRLTDFPYSLAAVGDGIVVCGCGDGSVHVVDAVEGKTLYALGAGQAAVRTLEVTPAGSLTCSGDDGCVVSYSFQ